MSSGTRPKGRAVGRGWIESLEGRRLLSASLVGGISPILRGGIVTRHLQAGNDVNRAVLAQPDGKLISVGDSLPTTYPSSVSDIALTRYNADGTVDTTFGKGGSMLFTLGRGHQDIPYAAALQPDGRIVVAGVDGSPTYSGAIQRPCVLRFNADGTPDWEFDAIAIASFEQPANPLRDLRAMALEPDGEVLVAGTAFGPTGDIGIARLKPDGTSDLAFGSQGFSTASFADNAGSDVFAMVLQPDGKAVLGGLAGTLGGNQFVLLRVDSHGALDPTFGSGGRVITPFTPGFDMDAEAYGIAAAPDGKIVAVGRVPAANVFTNAAVVRYNPDGSLDPSFGIQGRVVFTNQSSYDDLDSVSVLPDGRILASGGIHFGPTIIRLHADGSLDQTFGVGGMASTHLGVVYYSRAVDFRVLPGGDIVAAGNYGRTFGANLPVTSASFVSRLTADGAFDPSFGVPGDLNHDGIVNLRDYYILTRHFNQPGTFADGDINGDGIIDEQDYLLLKRNLGNTTGVLSQ